MKINYPIKYAVMPIIEQTGWSHGLHELEREYDVVCYIVSKCYLINDLTKYKEDGCSIKEYEVVFPYQPSEFNRWKRNIPEYNLIHRYCTNSNKVDAVYDSYEEALKSATTKNEKLCEKTWIYLPVTKDIMEKIQEKKDEFAAKLTEYKMLERQILLNTNDIEPGEIKKLDDVIKIENNSGRVFSCSIYGVLDLFSYQKFVVYNISQELYNNLIKTISEEKIDNIKSIIKNAQRLLIHKTKDDFIKLAIEEECGAHYIQNGSIIYDYNLDKVTKETFEDIDEDTLTFYTTETMEDILNSYRKHPEIDPKKIQGPVLKKVKK